MNHPLDPGSDTPEPAVRRLQLAPGTELLGRYESTAFNQPQYLIRRVDGQTLQLSRLLYTVAAALDGHGDAAAAAGAASAELGRPVSADNVTYLVEHKLAPLGILGGDHEAAQLARANPLLGLRFRARVVPEPLHRGATRVFQPLFWPPVVAAVLLGVAAVNVRLFTTTGSPVLSGTRQLLLHPALLLLLTAMMIGAGAFHEIGHATAARYGGARPGVMGVGIYLMMPAFYTDVTDSYRLDRRGRLRTDLGGVYFNGVAVLASFIAYTVTGFRPLLVFIVMSELEVLYQFVPFVRMDGYYVVADLIGVPNLFAFLGPAFAALVRRNRTGPDRLAALTRWARTAISIWVAMTVPILAVNLIVLGFVAPRLFPTMWTSARTLVTAMAHELPHAQVVSALNHLTQLVLLVIPAAGIVFMVATLARRVGGGVLRALEKQVPELAPGGVSRRRVGVAMIATCTVVAAAGVLAAVVSLSLQRPTLSSGEAAGAVARPAATSTGAQAALSPSTKSGASAAPRHPARAEDVQLESARPVGLQPGSGATTPPAAPSGVNPGLPKTPTTPRISGHGSSPARQHTAGTAGTPTVTPSPLSGPRALLSTPGANPRVPAATANPSVAIPSAPAVNVAPIAIIPIGQVATPAPSGAIPTPNVAVAPVVSGAVTAPAALSLATPPTATVHVATPSPPPALPVPVAPSVTIGVAAPIVSTAPSAVGTATSPVTGLLSPAGPLTTVARGITGTGGQPTYGSVAAGIITAAAMTLALAARRGSPVALLAPMVTSPVAAAGGATQPPVAAAPQAVTQAAAGMTTPLVSLVQPPAA